MSALVIIVVICILLSSSAAAGGLAWNKGVIPGTYLYNANEFNEYVKKLKKDKVCDREKLIKKLKQLKLADRAPEKFRDNPIVTEVQKNIKLYTESCGFTSI